MKLLMVLLLPIFFLTPKTSLAYTPKEGKVTATLGPYINKTNFQGKSSKDKSSYLGSYALIAVGDISNTGSLEIAMIYSPSMLFYREDAGKYLVERTQVMHITMGYRWWLSDTFSTSLAFYSAYSIGSHSIVSSDFTPPDFIDTSARDITEYGFDGAMQWEFWSNHKFAGVLGGRYSASLTRKKNEDSDQYGILVGLRYFVQEEKVIEKPRQ